MLVKWNGTNVWSIGSGKGDSSVIQIVPGPNEIKKEDWDRIKNHPVVKARMELDVVDHKSAKIVKKLEVVMPKEVKNNDGEDNADVEKDESSTSLSDMSVPEAKGLIAETFNTELLREWDESETRKGAKDAIKKQFEKIEEMRKEDADKSKDEDAVVE